MELTSLLIGLPIGFVLGYFVLRLVSKDKHVSRKEYDGVHARLSDSITEVRLAEERLRSHQELTNDRLGELARSLAEEKDTNRRQQQEINQHLHKLGELSTHNISLQDKLEKQKEELLEIQKTSQLHFEKLANQIFEEKSGKFTEANKLNIEALLKPLNENIDLFKKKVEETYDKESKERFSLGEKVKDLIENTQRVSQEANNLATALKGQVKKQGDWGETILESILEKSGLVKNREYFVQENVRQEDSTNVRPDIIVRLPDARAIVIDSKVSLNAYTRYCESEIKDDQDICLQAHLKSIRNHIDQLRAKKYDDMEGSVDFIIMFIPIEPAYLVAIQADPELWSDAYRKRILLISPTNLIAVLKIVADLWKRELQNKNALEIAKQGASMYEKFVGFLESLEKVGEHINRSQDAYLQAVKQLKEGRGNLVRQAERLRELGVKSSKKISARMLSIDDGEEDDIAMLPGKESDTEAEPGL